MVLDMESSLVTTSVSPSHAFRDFSGLEVRQHCVSVESGVLLFLSVKVNEKFDVRRYTQLKKVAKQ